MRGVTILLLLLHQLAGLPALAQQPTAPEQEQAAPGAVTLESAEPVPDWWEDRDFLRTISPFVGALIGFLGGTIVNHLLSLWRDAIRRRHEANGLRSGIMGELRANELYLITKRKRLEEHREVLTEGEAYAEHVPGVTHSMLQHLGQEPSDEIFRSYVDRLAALTAGEIGLIITLYSRLKQEHEDTRAWSEDVSRAHGTAEMLDRLEKTFDSQMRLISIAIKHLRRHQLGPLRRVLAWIVIWMNRRSGSPDSGAD